MGFGQLPIGSHYTAYYLLSDVNDASGNGRTLTNNNAVPFVQARFNNGADFESSGTNKGLNLAGDIFSDNSRTFAFWFKLNNTVSNNLNARFVQSNRANNNSRCIYNISGGNITIDFILDLVTTDAVASYTFAVDTNWHYVVCRVVSSTQVTMQVDSGGIITGTGSGGGVAASALIGIGNSNALTLQAWAIIDDVIFDDDVARWTPDLVGKYYTQAKGRFCI